MAQSLTKSNLKAIPYGKEVGFSRGIMGRKLKDGQSVRVFLQKKLHGKPIKAKIGTWPDISIDEIEERAREYRSLIEQGIHPYSAEEDKRKIRDDDTAEKARRGVTLRTMLHRLESHKVGMVRGNSKSIINDRRSTLERFFKQWMDKPVANISRAAVQDWRKAEHDAGHGKRANRSLIHLNTVLNHAMNIEDVIDKNPMTIFKGQLRNSEPPEKHALDPEECNDLLEMVEILTDPGKVDLLAMKLRKAQKTASTAQSVRDGTYIKPGEMSARRHVAYNAVALLLLSGVRLQELLKLEWDHVFFDERKWKGIGARGPFFRITQYKLNGMPTGIPITKYMKGSFEALKNLRVDKFVFPSPMSGSYDEAPIRLLRYQFVTLDKLLPHMKNKLGANLLRHTFATTASRLHYSLDQIDRLTGHTGKLDSRNVATNLYIANSADDNRTMFEAINVAMLGIEDLQSNQYEAVESSASGDFEVVKTELRT